MNDIDKDIKKLEKNSSNLDWFTEVFMVWIKRENDTSFPMRGFDNENDAKKLAFLYNKKYNTTDYFVTKAFIGHGLNI